MNRRTHKSPDLVVFLLFTESQDPSTMISKHFMTKSEQLSYTCRYSKLSETFSLWIAEEWENKEIHQYDTGSFLKN